MTGERVLTLVSLLAQQCSMVCSDGWNTMQSFIASVMISGLV
jgi:hypothetical protein